MTTAIRSLLDYRVVVVTGKGGTGKTTIAAALADAATRAGRRVVLAETAALETVAGLFEKNPEPLGYEGRWLRPGLHAIQIDPRAALAEYLGLQIGLRALAERVLRTETFRQLLEAVPGWRELIILGKIWHLEQKQNRDGTPAYDLVIVDAPATGHGMTFLDVPRVVQQAVRAGPLMKHAGWVEELIHDHQRTLLLPVTLPEELPVLETHELVARARGGINIAVDRIVVNAMPDRQHPHYSRRLGELKTELGLKALPPVDQIRELLAHSERREDLAIRERARVSALCELPLVDVPFSSSALESSDDWTRIVDSILTDPIWPDSESASPETKT